MAALRQPRTRGGARYAIAVVDDDAEVRRLLAARFKRVPSLTLAGEATNGADAVELARSTSLDLMVIDLRMPVMGGAEAIPLLRAAAPGLWIVVHSSLLEGEDLSGECRPDAAVVNRGNLDELVAVVLGLLERDQQQAATG